MTQLVTTDKDKDEDTREYYRKQLYEKSLKSLGEIPQLEEPNEEQKEWLKRRGIK